MYMPTWAACVCALHVLELVHACSCMCAKHLVLRYQIEHIFTHREYLRITVECYKLLWWDAWLLKRGLQWFIQKKCMLNPGFTVKDIVDRFVEEDNVISRTVTYCLFRSTKTTGERWSMENSESKHPTRRTLPINQWSYYFGHSFYWHHEYNSLYRHIGRSTDSISWGSFSIGHALLPTRQWPWAHQ